MTNLNVAIFGCSGAIGKALCIEYTKKQNIDNIIAYSRSGENFENDLIKSIKVDYCNEESLSNAVSSLQFKLDIIIVAIGSLDNPEKSIKDLSAQKFLDMFNANTIPTALIAKYFLPCLYRDKTTKFASISARVGSIEDNELGGWYSYRASKAAVNNVMVSISEELKSENITVVSFHPGWVKTDMGGPNADLSANESAKSLIKSFGRLKFEDTGKFFNYDGKIINF